ncbi:hypothetical protein BCR41DRAFT_371157 [Lobosporangium transversale]|uniref:Protein Zds1 C-terminal domain-containing protein n=1 Tax=Lobosporangium transversale TaxID=64571 RepID=A0A1Y2GLA1_9FUNG|nr:hypothetical protein BCR41DRAFT_371157 [Lobosporangium transversale]ORZ14320.1 hypothetical protein BCR41DRAFT_371157 [Lobosporangium transversale]|eukprot:XP_021880798.1 hypothetical protein BCR41DRAFT_371157 [Lobosporangium transversale]
MTGSKKKTLSASSISSSSSATSSSSVFESASSSTSSTLSMSSPYLTATSPEEANGDVAAKTSVNDTVLAASPSTSTSILPVKPINLLNQAAASDVLKLDQTVSQDAIKGVQIEAEDPSHLFWVPFHMHPEIAPNEYNKWLLKHGVDSSGNGGLLSARKASLNRRKSVLSSQYNPGEDDEDEKQTSDKLKKKLSSRQMNKDVTGKNKGQDFLSGIFSVPLENMGEPPLKTKALLRRSSSHTQASPRKGDEPGFDAIAENTMDMAAEDLATVKRGSALTRHGLSLLRRSARTKIRRNSTTSSESKNDTSRLRPSVIENGDYPAVTLVDPGPLPLPSSSFTSISPEVATATALSTPVTSTIAASPTINNNGLAVRAEPSGPKPIKRFVSTLRDPSKPTITTYVEPQLLEQRQKEIEEALRSSMSTSSAPNLASLTVSADSSKQVQANAVRSVEKSTTLSVESAVVSKISYPIPPPVKLNQNLLQQQPLSSSKISPSPVSSTQKHTVTIQKQSISTAPSQVKKSSSWSRFWAKEKGSEKSMEAEQRSNQNSFAQQQPSNNSATSTETIKKQSTFSLLFSRNSKAPSKVQATGSTTYVSSPPNGMIGHSPKESYLSDPCRMPIHIERAIYKMSHIKLADPRRPLHEQVLISNMMFWYLGVIQQQQQQLELQQQQQVQQSSQIQQGVVEARQTHDQMSTHSLEAKENSSQNTKSHSDGLILETRVEGYEYIVPQQDSNSNSHARPPSKNIAHESPQNVSFNGLPMRDDAEYDEESMIGGGFDEELDWSDDEVEGKEDAGAGSLYLQSEAQASSSFQMHPMQSGSSPMLASQDTAPLTYYPESRRPDTVSVS